MSLEGFMEQLLQEFGHRTFTPFPVIAARLLLATLFGAVIGFEREWRRRPAGLRTHILVCVAAATFAILTIEIVHAPVFVGNAVRLDPIRAVEAVTAGVAFLAAGTILFARGEVHGLTTGAGMWLAGAIGLAAGLGLWQIAVFGTVLALIVLGLLQTLEARFDLNKGTDFSNPARGDKDAQRAVEPKPDDPSHVQPSGR
jgi:putative Mg2+ transporter-C (MgtC) family protein